MMERLGTSSSFSGSAEGTRFQFQISNFKSQMRERAFGTAAKRILGAIALSIAITLPWQLIMLARHGRAFAGVFYVSEGAMPALQVVENHPGNPAFYFMILHYHPHVTAGPASHPH